MEEMWIMAWKQLVTYEQNDKVLKLLWEMPPLGLALPG